MEAGTVRSALVEEDLAEEEVHEVEDTVNFEVMKAGYVLVLGRAKDFSLSWPVLN